MYHSTTKRIGITVAGIKLGNAIANYKRCEVELNHESVDEGSNVERERMTGCKMSDVEILHEGITPEQALAYGYQVGEHVSVIVRESVDNSDGTQTVYVDTYQLDVKSTNSDGTRKLGEKNRFKIVGKPVTYKHEIWHGKKGKTEDRRVIHDIDAVNQTYTVNGIDYTGHHDDMVNR